MSEKLCVQWNDFKDNVIGAFGILREDEDFADVTLACEDGKQMEAHKVILATSSPFFQNLLMRNKHAHPLIYMRGVKSEDLLTIIDFLYCGQADVLEENLERFLAISKELQLKGFTGKTDGSALIQRESVKMSLPKKVNKVKKKEANIFISSNILEPSCDEEIFANELETISDLTNSLTNNPVSEDFQELEEKCKSMMEKTAKKQANGYPLYMCKVCGKEEIKSGMTKHIEANHVEGLSLPCTLCETTFR